MLPNYKLLPVAAVIRLLAANVTVLNGYTGRPLNVKSLKHAKHSKPIRCKIVFFN